MKSKKITYLLITLVLILWGIIGYKLLHKSSEEGKDIFLFKNNTPVLAALKADNFELSFSTYPDPFLKKLKLTSVKIKSRKKHILKAIKKTTPIVAIKNIVIKWPTIVYQGLMRNHNAKKIGMMTIGGNIHLAKEGRTYNQVNIIKLYSDSIQVSYEKEIKTIHR